MTATPLPGALPLFREERIKHLCLDVRWNTDAVIADADLHAVAEVLSRRLSLAGEVPSAQFFATGLLS
jgi:hypothetical protein